MVKVKRKVEMTLPKLIEWGLENGIKSKRFASNRLNNKYVGFDSLGGVCFNGLYSYLQQDTFTIEVEEEITEETELSKFLEIFAYKNLGYGDENSLIEENKSIKEILEENEERSLITKAIHLVNNDGTHTLIWKDGELVGDE